MTVHAGDVGTTVEVTVTKDDGTVLDLSTATTKTLKFKPPTAVTIPKAAVFVTDGVDGKIKYTTGIADTVFATAGAWKVQVYVEIPAGRWHTDIATVTVEGNL